MELQEKWREHPLFAQGEIELIPTSWVWKYWGRDVSSQADLMDGTLVDLETLWENLVKEGLHNPLIMRVGVKNKTFRLEAGNHRIQVLHKHGIECVPVTVQIREECGPHVADVMNDATHNFIAPEGFLCVFEVTDEYMRPSRVFSELKGPHTCSHLT